MSELKPGAEMDALDFANALERTVAVREWKAEIHNFAIGYACGIRFALRAVGALEEKP